MILSVKWHKEISCSRFGRVCLVYPKVELKFTNSVRFRQYIFITNFTLVYSFVFTTFFAIGVATG